MEVLFTEDYHRYKATVLWSALDEDWLVTSLVNEAGKEVHDWWLEERAIRAAQDQSEQDAFDERYSR